MDNGSGGPRFLLSAQEAGYIQVEWKEGVSVTKHDAAELLQRLEELSSALCPPMLVLLNNMVSLSRPARIAFASELNVSA